MRPAPVRPLVDPALPTRPHPAMRNVWFLRGLAIGVAIFPFVSWPFLLPLAAVLRLTGAQFVASFFVAGGLLLVGFVAALWFWSRAAYGRLRFEIGLTEVVIERGVVLRTVTRIPLAKVRRVVLRNGPLLRRKGLASVRLVVEERWAATPYPVDGQLPGVRDAPAVAQVLVDRINRAKGGPATTAPPLSPTAR